ncbi:MAG: hypothetical protein DWH78_03315, partial [Planctomycetota bacterium]
AGTLGEFRYAESKPLRQPGGPESHTERYAEIPAEPESNPYNLHIRRAQTQHRGKSVFTIPRQNSGAFPC